MTVPSIPLEPETSEPPGAPSPSEVLCATTESTLPPSEGLAIPHRDPLRAALWSTLVPGGGQVYNKQLDKAMLLGISITVWLGVGIGLVVTGILGAVLPGRFKPPIGDWIGHHPAWFASIWLAVSLALWFTAIRDAKLTAERLNAGEVRVLHGMRRQMVHVLASQLLGFIPFVGLLFPPAVVAEAIDSVRDRRKVSGKRLIRDGGQAILEWAALKIAVWALMAVGAVWALWWLLRMVGLPI